MNSELARQINVVVQLLSRLNDEEPHPAYSALFDIYKRAKDRIESGAEKKEIEQLLSFTTRRLQEAPPNNDEFGVPLLIEMSKAIQLANEED